MSYGYFLSGFGTARWRRMTIRERIRLRKRRKRMDDLAGLREWK